MLAFSSTRKQYSCITSFITEIIHRYTNIPKHIKIKSAVKHALLELSTFKEGNRAANELANPLWNLHPGGVMHNVEAILKALQPLGRMYKCRTYSL